MLSNRRLFRRVAFWELPVRDAVFLRLPVHCNHTEVDVSAQVTVRVDAAESRFHRIYCCGRWWWRTRSWTRVHLTSTRTWSRAAGRARAPGRRRVPRTSLRAQSSAELLVHCWRRRPRSGRPVDRGGRVWTPPRWSAKPEARRCRVWAALRLMSPGSCAKPSPHDATRGGTCHTRTWSPARSRAPPRKDSPCRRYTTGWCDTYLILKIKETATARPDGR